MRRYVIHIYELELYKKATGEQLSKMRICKIRYFELENLPSRERDCEEKSVNKILL